MHHSELTPSQTVLFFLHGTWTPPMAFYSQGKRNVIEKKRLQGGRRGLGLNNVGKSKPSAWSPWELDFCFCLSRLPVVCRVWKSVTSTAVTVFKFGLLYSHCHRVFNTNMPAERLDYNSGLFTVVEEKSLHGVGQSS
jgi:hypothetical protein